MTPLPTAETWDEAAVQAGPELHRRIEPRYSVDQAGWLTIHGSTAPVPVRIRNISRSGMQLECPAAVPAGSRISINWKDHEIEAIVCNQAKVGDEFQLGVELLATWESLVNEVLARQSEQLAIAKTELEETNRELATALESARQAGAVKGRFLASVSHELRTPLNGIIGFSELLVDGRVGALKPEQRECTREILECSRHLLSLVGDLLDLSKIEAGRLEFDLEKVELAPLIADVIDNVRPLADAKGLVVRLRCDPQVTEVTADPLRLKQVLYNYLSNAVKFTPANGRITVRLSSAGSLAYRIDVEDSGVGIRTSDLPRLFSEFGQLENCGKGGIGLGLALTKRIVEAQGGSVGVRSELGRGSTFFAILPTAGKANTAARL